MLSLFDRLWHKDLTEEEAVKLMELGIEEVSLPDPSRIRQRITMTVTLPLRLLWVAVDPNIAWDLPWPLHADVGLEIVACRSHFTLGKLGGRC